MDVNIYIYIYVYTCVTTYAHTAHMYTYIYIYMYHKVLWPREHRDLGEGPHEPLYIRSSSSRKRPRDS